MTIFSNKLKASNRVFGEVTFPEVEGFFESPTLGIFGQVNCLHVVWADQVVADSC